MTLANDLQLQVECGSLPRNKDLGSLVTLYDLYCVLCILVHSELYVGMEDGVLVSINASHTL